MRLFWTLFVRKLIRGYRSEFQSYCKTRSNPGICPSTRDNCPSIILPCPMSVCAVRCVPVHFWVAEGGSPTIKPPQILLPQSLIPVILNHMNLIFTPFSTIFLGVLALAAPNPQEDGCVPFPCGPFTCPLADQNDQALISSSANSTTLTCVYRTLEVPCIYMQSDVSLVE